MIRALHETCIEYFRRRLSEGWKCISLDGYNAVLLSPEGIRRELDLRNDVLTLRPNADLVIGMTRFPDTGEESWEDIDEVVPDENDTYVKPMGIGGSGNDRYGLPDHTTEAGIINSVTIYGRLKEVAGNYNFQFGVYTYATTHWAGQHAMTASWENYNDVWNNNPETTDPWTWDEIDALALYLQISGAGGDDAYCTQVYVEVDFTPAPPAVAKPHTFMLDPKPRTRAKFYPSLKLGG